VPVLTGSLSFRTIDPTADPVLDGFCCGERGKRSENDVHGVIRQLRSGERTIPEVRVAEEVPPGRLVGVVAVGQIGFQDRRLVAYNGAPYITVIALSKDYRGAENRGDGSPLGDFLMVDALTLIDRRRGGGMPRVFAFVDEANAASCELFQRHGFELIIRAISPEADALFRRPKNLKVSSIA
jgi:ribosomal protein S18 acetylase RimI-like enzyme